MMVQVREKEKEMNVLQRLRLALRGKSWTKNNLPTRIRSSLRGNHSDTLNALSPHTSVFLTLDRPVFISLSRWKKSFVETIKYSNCIKKGTASLLKGFIHSIKNFISSTIIDWYKIHYDISVTHNIWINYKNLGPRGWP